MTAQTVARAMEKRDTGLDKLMWKNARHLESILPEHVDVKAFLGTAWAALLANDTLMQNAVDKPDTLLIALFRCAAKGHQPGTEEYYLTPRDGGVLGIEGYRGIIERMYRSGAVAKVVVREVCAKDYFRLRRGRGREARPRLRGPARRHGRRGFLRRGREPGPRRHGRRVRGGQVHDRGLVPPGAAQPQRRVRGPRFGRVEAGRQVQPVEQVRRGRGPPRVPGPLDVA